MCMLQIKDGSDNRIGLLLAIVAFLVYANSLWNGFVWDDVVVILANIPRISNPLDIFSSIDSGRSLEIAPYYRPLSLLSFYGEYRLHGLNPLLVRLCNLILHAGNTFLVYRLAVSVYICRKAAFIAALLFSIHPIHAEVVDFNSGGRNTMLATLFSLLALLLHQKSVTQNRFLPALGGAASAFAGFLSKEIALGIIPFIAALEIARLRGDPLTRRNAIIRLAPYAVFIVLYWVLRKNALGLANVKLEIFPDLWLRLQYNAYIIPKYLFSLVWPVNLSPFYLIPEDLLPIAIQLILSWGIIAAVLWWLIWRGTRPVVCFGLAWLVIFWLPVSGIFPFPSSPVADRYFYIPALGVWILIAEHIARFYSAESSWKHFRQAVIVVLFICLAGLTFRQNRYWNNGVTLFSRVLELAPESVYALHNLGCAYLEQKNNTLAEKAFIKASMLDPTFPRLQDKLGYIRLQQGDYNGALQFYGEAIRQNPYDAEAHLNSAILLEKLSRFEEALLEYQRFYACPGDELAEARAGLSTKVEELSRLIAKRNAGRNTK